MPRVDLFPIDSRPALPADLRIPFQYLGGGATPAAAAMELSQLLAFMQANLVLDPPPTLHTLSPGGSLTVPAARLLRHIVVLTNGTARTLSCGRTPGGSDVMDAETIPATKDLVLMTGIHSQVASTVLHFHGFTGTIQVKLFF